MADNTPSEDQQNADQNNTNPNPADESQPRTPSEVAEDKTEDQNADEDQQTDTDDQAEEDEDDANADEDEDQQNAETPPDAGDQGGKAGDDEETQKSKAQAEYKERESRRKQLKAQDDALNSSFEDWVNEAGDDETQRAVRELQAERQLTRIERAQHTIASENQKAVKEFDIFNPESKSYDPEAYKEAIEDFAPYMDTDELIDPGSGEKVTVVLGAKKSLYQHLQQRARRLERYRQSAQQEGEKKGQRNAQKERMRSEPQFNTAGGSRAKDTRKDSELSAAEFAKKHKLGTVRA